MTILLLNEILVKFPLGEKRMVLLTTKSNVYEERIQSICMRWRRALFFFVQCVIKTSFSECLAWRLVLCKKKTIQSFRRDSGNTA